MRNSYLVDFETARAAIFNVNLFCFNETFSYLNGISPATSYLSVRLLKLKDNVSKFGRSGVGPFWSWAGGCRLKLWPVRCGLSATCNIKSPIYFRGQMLTAILLTNCNGTLFILSFSSKLSSRC